MSPCSTESPRSMQWATFSSLRSMPRPWTPFWVIRCSSRSPSPHPKSITLEPGSIQEAMISRSKRMRLAAGFMEDPLEEAADQGLEPVAGDQEGVVTPLGLDLAEAHVPPALFQRLDDVARLVGRVEPVRGEGDDQELGQRLGEGAHGRAAAVLLAQVVVVGRLGDVEEGVGVEAVDELPSLVAQVALHLEVRVEVEV